MKTTIPPKDKVSKEARSSAKEMEMEEAMENAYMEKSEIAKVQETKLTPEMQKRIDKLKSYTSGNVDALQK